MVAAHIRRANQPTPRQAQISWLKMIKAPCCEIGHSSLWWRRLIVFTWFVLPADARGDGTLATVILVYEFGIVAER